MVKDAWYFLVPVGLMSALFYGLGVFIFGTFFFLLALFIAYFFRDPERQIPGGNTVVSPADGQIIRLERQENGTALSIFLSVFDVHVNRAPLTGKIVRNEYRRGRFLVAYDDQASVENERVILAIDGQPEPVTFALVAGIVARRIRVWKREGEQVQKGERIGLIRFGSRVDIVLPPCYQVAVEKGDRVYGGSSVIARWESCT